MEDDGLTPTQRRALVDLLGKGQPRPSFPSELAGELRSELETSLGDVADGLVDVPLVVHKGALSQVHSCERHHVAEARAGFSWTPAAAMGAVAHKAIELSITMRSAPAMPFLVDTAVDRLSEDIDRGPGAWLAEASAAEVAELRAGVIDRTLKFEDEFPPVKRKWRPRLESPLVASLCDDRIVVRGKVDLALGRPRGLTAGVLIVELKTGRPSRAHADDLRLYALLETLRAGVPPFRVATWYLDSGQHHHEDVDEALLRAAVRRVCHGVRKIYELQVEGRTPTWQAGAACDWCVERHTCEGALARIEQRRERGLEA